MIGVCTLVKIRVRPGLPDPICSLYTGIMLSRFGEAVSQRIVSVTPTAIQTLFPVSAPSTPEEQCSQRVQGRSRAPFCVP